jgi:uroporphyrin-III C-methyltransferase
LIASLAELPDRVEAEGFASPSIVVVGEVVAQRVEACAPEPADAEMPIAFSLGSRAAEENPTA